MKTNISIANRFILHNLFWIVPLNFTLLIFGIGSGLTQRTKSLQNDEELKEHVLIQITSDSILKRNQDSLLRNTKDLRDLIKK